MFSNIVKPKDCDTLYAGKCCMGMHFLYKKLQF